MVSLSNLLGMHLTLYLGPTIAVPAPEPVMESLSSVEVRNSGEGRDGFQLTFTIGRGPSDVLDYPLLANPLLKPFGRVVVQVWAGVLPNVLIDGWITNHQISPGEEPGTSLLTVTGEDVRVLMSLHELALPYPQMPPNIRVETVLAKYIPFIGSVPVAMPTVPPNPPLVVEKIPVQAESDLAYVERQARRFGYVFYVEPTPVPNVNICYWGKENRFTFPQKAISVNVGPESNVRSLNFQYDGLRPATVLGAMLEKRTGAPLPVVTFASTQFPMAVLPATVVQQPFVRSVKAPESGGLEYPEAYAQAQALTDRASDAVTAEGELDALQYGDILRARRLVGVRGAGWLLDGQYYVKQVTHSIKKGEYRQRFSLTRGGFGSLTPVVNP